MGKTRSIRVSWLRIVIFRLARHGHRALLRRPFRPLTVTSQSLTNRRAHVRLLSFHTELE
jgi:hypothetical protein